MPCRRRPSIAALTRSGARKASEIVILTLPTLQPSRVAMLSALRSRIRDELVEPAAAAGNRCDQESAVLGTYCAGVLRGHDAGTSISQRRLSGVLCHGTFSVLRLRDRLEPVPFARA